MQFKSNPSQHCFCRDGDPEKCPPKGVIDKYEIYNFELFKTAISLNYFYSSYPCMGVPMIISKPHFLDADKSLLKAVDGLKPVKTLHDNYLQFEMVRT